MDSSILIKIKWIYRIANVWFAYFITYNTYFGWNKIPQSRAEEVCDNITSTTAGLMIGIFINICLSYIKFRMNKELKMHKTFKELLDHEQFEK